MGRLEGKVAIVTGAAGGIGHAFCRRLAQEGAKVVATDIKDIADVIADVEAQGSEGLALTTDVTSEESTIEMARQTVERFGKVDILVNNAALFSGIHGGPFTEIDMDEWDRVFKVNVKGPFLCTRAVFPYMKEQHSGKIINIASGIFLTVMVGTPHYVSSKAAVFGLTRVLAKELGQHGINVNSIAPGNTDSGAVIHRENMPWQPVTPGRAFDRTQLPEDLTGTLVYLASEDSDFVTGNLHLVNGGGALW